MHGYSDGPAWDLVGSLLQLRCNPVPAGHHSSQGCGSAATATERAGPRQIGHHPQKRAPGHFTARGGGAERRGIPGAVPEQGEGVDTREVIRRYLIEHSATPSITTFDEELSLLDQGVLDSFGLVTLVEFLEVQFGLQVADDEIDAVVFSTFHRLCDFVERKQAGRNVTPSRGPTG